MDGNKKAGKPANSNIRCRNCSLKVPNLKKNRSLRDATSFMKDVLQSWIAPTPVLPDDYLCKECFSILQELPEEKGPPAPLLGNRCVCFGCGTSFLQTRARTVDLKNPLRDFLIKRIPAHLVPRLTRVCDRCWHHALLEMRRKESFDSRRLLEKETMSRLLEKETMSRLLEKETMRPLDTNGTIPLKQLLVPVRVEAKPPRRSSSTESVDSEELKNIESTTKLSKKKLKQRKSQKLTRVKSQPLLGRPPQKNDFETSFQYRYERLPAYTLMEIRRMIYRVYRYLNTEYNSMKAQTKGPCDLSPLADIVMRTATATGVTQDTVRKIVKEKEAETLKNNKKQLKIVRRDHSPAAQLVARDHCYYLSPPRQPAQYNTQETLLEPRSRRPAQSRQTAQCTTNRVSRKKSRRKPPPKKSPPCNGGMQQDASGTSIKQEKNHQEDQTEPMEDDKSELILKCEVFDEGVQQSHSTVHHTPPDIKLEAPVKVEPEEDQYEQCPQESPWQVSAPPPLVWTSGGDCPMVIRPGLLEDYPEDTRVQETNVPANTFEPLADYPEQTRLQVTNVPAKTIFEPPDGYPPEQTEIQVTRVPANTYDMAYIKYIKEMSESDPWNTNWKPKRRSRQKIRLST